MSAVLLDSSCLLSAVQPNFSSSTTYVLPSGGPCLDPEARVRRVQEQVRKRLQEKKRSTSMTRLDHLAGTADEYFLPETKNFAFSPAFSSRSMISQPSRVMAVPSVPLHLSSFTNRSAVETSFSSRHRQSTATSAQSSFQTQRRSGRSKSLCQEAEPAVGPLPADVITTPPSGSLRRSLSGTLAPERGLWQDDQAAAAAWALSTYKGPAHRTISRITNRQQQQSYSLEREGWLSGSKGVHVAAGGEGHASVGGGSYQVPLKRTASVRSVRSVGKGVDVLDRASMHSNDAFAEFQSLDMNTAVRYLSEPDVALQILGAAYIQHLCYHSNDAKNQVRTLHGIPVLVQLFSSENVEVQRYATSATRNLIYENTENKVALIEAGGLRGLVEILKEPDEELRKTITGVLWNLSSRDNLKEKLCKEVLAELTAKVLVPLCSSLPMSSSERDVFYNTSGCLRNLSSVNERTRQKMRDMPGLVDSLVSYIQQEAEDKGLENSLCVMRNLSYQLYSELPPVVRRRLEGPSRSSASRTIDTIGCFTLYNKKHAEQKHHLNVLSEVSRQPKGAEWLWNPKVVSLYKNVLHSQEISVTSREAAIGALQNITTGESWWCSVLVAVVVDQEKMLPLLLDSLESSTDGELRPLTGLLRNVARHAGDKEHMAKTVVNVVVSKLPCDGFQKTPSSEVVSNLCGILNHLVSCSSAAARDITFYNGLPKLVSIKNYHDSSPGSQKASRAASTVLYNMFQYNKLHKDYKLKGFSRQDFADASV